MNNPTTLDEIVDIVATHEPVSSEEVHDHIDSDGIDLQQVENLLSVALERERVLKVNGRFWVMRVGKYADEIA